MPPPETSTRESAIRLEQVRKEFNGTVALHELDLSVHTGELYAFLGPNGAGKTTTIKIITGLMNPTSGRVSVRNISLAENDIEARRRIAYVPDQPYLYDKLTGREFLEFTGRLYDMDPPTIRERIDTYTDLFQMSDYLDDLGETYSHGMKQRVVLSATFLHEPEVILVDEPLVGLDPESSRLVRRLFRDWVDRGNTIFMSTHVLSIAEEVADRIGVISSGRMIAEGTLAELQGENGDRDETLEDLYLRITGTENDG